MWATTGSNRSIARPHDDASVFAESGTPCARALRSIHSQGTPSPWWSTTSLHDQFVAEHAAIDDLIGARRVDDVLVTALASYDFGPLLDYDEAGGLELKLLALLKVT
jgi:hypothetical protein